MAAMTMGMWPLTEGKPCDAIKLCKKKIMHIHYESHMQDCLFHDECVGAIAGGGGVTHTAMCGFAQTMFCPFMD